MTMNHAGHDVCCGAVPTGAARLRAWSGIVALVALAAFLGFSYLAGRTRFFVAESYVWLTPAAALLILAMTAARWSVQRNGRSGCGCESHQPGRFPQSACVMVVLVGVGFALVVNPQQYSAQGVYKRRAGLQARDRELETAMAWVSGRSTPIESAAATPAALGKTPTIAELLDAAATTPRSALEGEFVTVVGQCLLRGGPSEGRFDVYRLVVTCCVADASAVTVEVARNTAEALDPSGWVSIGGVLQFDSQENSAMPVIHAATVSKIAEPPSPYL